MLIDFVGDAVEVNVDESRGRVVEIEFDGLDAGHFLFGQFLGRVDEEGRVACHDIVTGRAVH
jgi:hypothetical protein